MEFITFMRIDDLFKYLLVDTYLQFSSRKIYVNDVILTDSTKLAMKKIMEFIEIDSIDNTCEKIIKLGLSSEYDSLFHKFQVHSMEWVKHHLKLYVNFFKDTKLKLIQCNRYKNDENRGVKIITNCKLSSKDYINLQGLCIKISKQEEESLFNKKADFSIFTSSKDGQKLLFLGPAAFVNHDCQANSNYTSKVTKICKIDFTKVNVKITENIDKGKEVTCFYAPHYFGLNNQCCECYSCEEKEKGAFSK